MKLTFKKYLLISTLAFSCNFSSEDKLMFDGIKIDDNTRLIGRSEQSGNESIYRNWNFYIDNPTVIKEVLKELTVGPETAGAFETPAFIISIIQQNNQVKDWLVNPTLKSTMYEGHTYQFDVEKVKKLGGKYPLEYKEEEITFSNKEAYDKYLTIQKENKNFLFDYSPQFKYEGSFEVKFPKTNLFSSPKTISEYLEPLIEKVVTKNEYRLSFILDEKNMNDQNQFTMTIAGSKKIFDNLTLDGFGKGNWEPTVEKGFFFYKTN
jgi:hypothetical protein